ncbi:MAG: NUDIX hydrolase [Candidatus Amoebophilus sp.]
MVKIYQTIPYDFNSNIQVVICFVYISKRFLLLKRASNESDPGSWGIPGGKIEEYESPLQAMKRELFEETSLESNPSLRMLGSLFFRRPTIDYTLHTFELQLNEPPRIYLSKEHSNYKWVSKLQMKKFKLISGTNQVYRYFYQNIIDF